MLSVHLRNPRENLAGLGTSLSCSRLAELVYLAIWMCEGDRRRPGRMPAVISAGATRTALPTRLLRKFRQVAHSMRAAMVHLTRVPPELTRVLNCAAGRPPCGSLASILWFFTVVSKTLLWQKGAAFVKSKARTGSKALRRNCERFCSNVGALLLESAHRRVRLPQVEAPPFSEEARVHRHAACCQSGRCEGGSRVWP